MPNTNSNNKYKYTNNIIFPDSILSKLESVAPKMGKTLYKRYTVLINDYRLEQFDKLGVDAGKFVEEFVRVVLLLEGLSNKLNIKKKSIKNIIDNIISSLKNQNKPNAEEKEVMLNIAYYSIYILRNRRDAAHINPTPLSQWDARHIIETSTWLVQELLRIYGNVNDEEIVNLFYPFNNFLNYLKVVEFVDGRFVPLVEKLGYKEQILLVLLSKSECLTPKEIINIIPNIKPVTVYDSLYKLSKKNLVVKIGDRFGCYKITSKGIQYILDKIKNYYLNNEEVKTHD